MDAAAARVARPGLAVLGSLWPFLWRFRGRVLLALGFMLAAKLANIGVPVLLKAIVDALAPTGPAAVAGQLGTTAGAGGDAPVTAVPVLAVAVVPLALILGYGLLRLATTLFTECRELVFARVTRRAVRDLSVQVFRHMNEVSLRFHLDRQTGGLTRDIERGTRAVSSLVSMAVYNILPTLIEIGLVLGYLAWNYDLDFTLISALALLLYGVWSVRMTRWLTGFRRTLNESDSRANVRAIDALVNYETVKTFGNEALEARRYDEGLRDWEEAGVRLQRSLSALNLGQSVIIALAVTLMVWRATRGVVDGSLSLGDLVLINAFMIQLTIPLNFLGMVYREVRQSLTDLERLFGLLAEPREVADAPDARPLVLAGATIRFEDVHFSYDAKRPILAGVSFEIGAGETVAVVGPSGAGKSTLSRLLFRFYDVDAGRITIDGQDIRSVSQASLRRAIGIVPQDTVLFNDSIRYNLAYGRLQADDEAVRTAARRARLDALLERLPAGWDTVVGERGLKLSGGEKQRVAIARVLLKDPAILVLDEATSALDSRNEKAIQAALDEASQRRTTLVIAHRLSTIVRADRILVLVDGRIEESGRHEELLALGGRYARMWALQRRDETQGGEGAGQASGPISGNP